MPIRVLPQTLINQIAAGEVVVNMASVVKELVENALDAGATRIEIELGNNLRDLVIADNGSGMDRDDAELCLQRHATSKISRPEDLFQVKTRGFRGEAVPSIASVSRFGLRTRPAGQIQGTRIVVEGGTIEKIESIGCPEGTRMTVRDLFFNTPARRKFLKSPVAEMNAIMRTLVRQALAVPAVGFRVVRDGEVRLELGSGQTLAERFESIAGSRLTAGTLELDFEREGARVTGLLARPQSSRGDRRSQYLFVNGRPFTHRAIGAAIEQACRGYIMTQRYPMFCVFIEVPTGEVDVNVHPAKEEVRFRNERNVAGTCYHAARQALEADGYVPDMALEDTRALEQPPARPAPLPDRTAGAEPLDLIQRAFDRKIARERQEPSVSGPAAVPPRSNPARPARGETGRREPVAAAPGERPEPEFWNKPYDPEPLGQIAETYIVVRFGEDLLIVDQHAAHERLRFIELSERFGAADSQTLLVPQTFDVAPDRQDALEAFLPELAGMGFTIEPFGGRTYAITAIPGDLAQVDASDLITDLLDEFEDAPRSNAVASMRERLLIRAACHSSIRAGRHLEHEEMVELLDLMRRHRLSFTCPHGRPTIVRLSKGELEKRFGRLG